jgi:hypothetical protein
MLASIASSDQHNAVVNYARAFTQEALWIGLNDLANEGGCPLQPEAASHALWLDLACQRSQRGSRRTASPAWVSMIKPSAAQPDTWLAGTFVWADGSLPTFTQWNFDQPDNWEGAEDCALIRYDNQWGDVPCDQSSEFVCMGTAAIPSQVSPLAATSFHRAKCPLMRHTWLSPRAIHGHWSLHSCACELTAGGHLSSF